MRVERDGGEGHACCEACREFFLFKDAELNRLRRKVKINIGKPGEQSRRREEKNLRLVGGPCTIVFLRRWVRQSRYESRVATLRSQFVELQRHRIVRFKARTRTKPVGIKSHKVLLRRRKAKLMTSSDPHTTHAHKVFDSILYFRSSYSPIGDQSAP